MNVIKSEYWWGYSFTVIAPDGKASVSVQFDKCYNNGFIESLVVAETERRKGRATELIKFAEGLIRTEGKPVAALYVEKRLPWLVDFYKRNGYVEYIVEDLDEHLIALQKVLT